MKKIFLIALSIAVLSIPACQIKNEKDSVEIEKLGRSSDEKTTALTVMEYEKKDEEQSNNQSTDSTGQLPTPDRKGSPGNPVIVKQDWDKKIIKTGNLSVSVKDYNAYYRFIREMVRQAGGYIAQENQQQSEYKIENVVVIKVPVDQFDMVMMGVSSNIEKVLEKSISSEDVTGAIVDTRSRMEAKKQVRARYLELLRQVNKMSDVLEVQSVVNSVQEEIETAAGRVAYLSQSAAYSTINLTYFQVLNASAVKDQDPSFGTRVGEAFNSGWKWVVGMTVGVLTVWPLWVIIGTIIFLVRRFAKGRQPIRTSN